MSNFNSLFSKLDSFYDSFETHLDFDVSEGFLTVNYKNKLINCRVISPLRQGKITIIKSGESYFATQGQVPKQSLENRVEIVDVFKNPSTKKDVPYILLVLSEKTPINIELRNNYAGDINLIPNLQVVEDIYVVDKKNSFGGLTLADLRKDGNVAQVKEPYLTFFSYLKKEKDVKYNSFYNYLTDSVTVNESLNLNSFNLDSDEEANSKLRVLDFIFPNSDLYSKFNFVTATKKETEYPFLLANKIGERPNQGARFKEALLKFYSTVLDKRKNLIVLNNLCPNLESYNYFLTIEVLNKNPLDRTISYRQIEKPEIIGTIQIKNYDNIQVGTQGILRVLPYGNFIQEIN